MECVKEFINIKLTEEEYEKKANKITEVKREHGKNLDRYQFLFTGWRAKIEQARKYINNDDINGLASTVEEIEEIVEDIHRIHVSLNKKLCDILNSLPG